MLSPDFSVGPVGLISDGNQEKSSRRVARSVRELAGSAQQCIMIETPYPALSKSTVEVLSRAVERGVQVTVMTNSLSTTDQTAVYATYQNHKRGSVTNKGIRLLEIGGDKVMHSKTMIIDGGIPQWSAVTTSTIDRIGLTLRMRSWSVIEAFNEALQRRVVRRARGATQIVNQADLARRPGSLRRSKRIQLMFPRRFEVLIYATESMMIKGMMPP